MAILEGTKKNLERIHRLILFIYFFALLISSLPPLPQRTVALPVGPDVLINRSSSSTIMGGRKLWQEKHTSYCFDKFTTDTPGKGQVDVWYLPHDANGTLALPKAQRGQGDDPIKRWFEEAQVDDPELWGTPMNLH